MDLFLVYNVIIQKKKWIPQTFYKATNSRGLKYCFISRSTNGCRLLFWCFDLTSYVTDQYWHPNKVQSDFVIDSSYLIKVSEVPTTQSFHITSDLNMHLESYVRALEGKHKNIILSTFYHMNLKHNSKSEIE